jgi:hypothetical protein
MSYKQHAKDLYDMISQGQLLEGFEKYYADDVVMVEVGEATRTGKDENREYEKKFLASVEQVHGMGIDSITADEDKAVTCVESWMDVTLVGVGRIMLKQAAVQYWHGEQIKEERFYHK